MAFSHFRQDRTFDYGAGTGLCLSVGVATCKTCEITMPGFNADSSIGPTTGIYIG